MSKDEILIILATLVSTLIMVIVLLIPVLWFKSWQCDSRWESSGLKTEWGPVKGCLVRVPDGRLIPDDRVREVDMKGQQRGN